MNGRVLLAGTAALATVLAIAGAIVVSTGREAETTPPEPSAPAASAAVDDVPRPSSTRRERGARRRIGAESERAAADAEHDAPAEPETKPPLRLQSITVAEGDTRRLPSDRPVHVTGDIRVAGQLDASRTTLVLDGGDQLIEGRVVAHSFVLRGGTKRLRGSTSSSQTKASAPGGAALYVEKDATLLLASDAQWNVPNPYGFQVAGHLILDGGKFVCRFTNGNGEDRGERSWLPGSSLTIHSGQFLGRGDADFTNATVTIYDGELAIDDDLWNTGETLNVYGGVVRNSTGGGAFVIKGAVNMSGGTLRVHQTGGRGLRIYDSARIACSGGLVTIRGRPARHEHAGILLRNSVTFHALDIETKTHVRNDSEQVAYLAVSHRLRITKQGTLDMRGRSLLADFTPSDESGRLIE